MSFSFNPHSRFSLWLPEEQKCPFAWEGSCPFRHLFKGTKVRASGNKKISWWKTSKDKDAVNSFSPSSSLGPWDVADLPEIKK